MRNKKKKQNKKTSAVYEITKKNCNRETALERLVEGVGGVGVGVGGGGGAVLKQSLLVRNLTILKQLQTLRKHAYSNI